MSEDKPKETTTPKLESPTTFGSPIQKGLYPYVNYYAT